MMMMMNLRTGRVAQHAVTGEKIEIRKFFPESGLVLIKIRRGSHFNTYKIRRELVWHVGDALQPQLAKAGKVAKVA